MIRLIILGLTAWFVMPFPGILPSLRLHRLSYARTCIFNDISKHPLSDLNSLNPKKISGPYSQSMKDKEMIRRISVKALHFAIGSAMLSSKVTSDIPYSEIVVTKLGDNRKYKALTLKNGLRVLLVSDNESQRSAAAMDVHVGSLSDPLEIPGLAHFCEHMSFLGTKKYPEEEGFTSFLATHGGSSNAYTDSEDTVYYFDVNSDHIDEALDRFAQFFSAPLFTASATDRELNAIDSEHAKNINNDGFRVYQLEKDIANPLHPLNKFATGNKDTLEKIPKSKGINVREALLNFHEKYYSANAMTLCIISNQSIADMEIQANKYFTSIPNRNAPDPALAWWGKIPPYGSSNGAKIVDIIPVDDVRKLSITWPIWIHDASEKEVYLRYKPESIIAHLLGHEGVGSLRSYLVHKGWINGIQASVTADLSDTQMFEVTISLTEQGLKSYAEVIDGVFAYIHLLQKQGIPSYIYDEVMKLSGISFNFSEKANPADYASRLVSDMQVYTNPSQYLTGSRLFQYTNLTDTMIQSYLSNLNAKNAIIFKLSKNLNKNNPKKMKIGRYYGTEYNDMISVPYAVRWDGIDSSDYPELQIPKPNIYIPENFDVLYPLDNEIKNYQEIKLKGLAENPIEIRRDGKWSVWHKVDKVFNQPKVYTIISYIINKSKYNALFVIHSKLFIALFMDSFNEYLYDTSLAGLRFDLSVSSRGLDIVFSGFNDKLDLFIQQVMRYLNDFKVTSNQVSSLNRFKDLLNRELINWKTQQPYMHCAYYLSLATETLQYTIDEMLYELNHSVSIDSINRFLDENIRVGSYGQALIIGNIDKTKSLDIVKSIDDIFHYEPLESIAENKSYRQVVEIPSIIALNDHNDNTLSNSNKIGYRIQHIEPNENDDNSATVFSFQLNSRDIQDTVNIELLGEAIEQPFYNSLRTQQQLGYIVFSKVRARDGIFSLTFTVQSSIVTGEELTNRINKFIDEIISSFSNIKEETLNQYKQGLITQKLEPDQRLTSHAQRLWSEIVLASIRSDSNGSTATNSDDPIKPKFDREIQEVKALQNITVEKFQQFVRDFLSVDGKNRRLIISEVTSAKKKNQKNSADSPADDRYESIKDEISFRKSQNLIP